jgi:hypothetical protein
MSDGIGSNVRGARGLTSCAHACRIRGERSLWEFSRCQKAIGATARAKARGAPRRLKRTKRRTRNPLRANCNTQQLETHEAPTLLTLRELAQREALPVVKDDAQQNAMHTMFLILISPIN